MSVVDCETILKAVNTAKVKLMVDFHNRWHPAFYKAHQMIKKGELGVPRFISLLLSDTTWVPLEMFQLGRKIVCLVVPRQSCCRPGMLADWGMAGKSLQRHAPHNSQGNGSR